MFYYDLQCLFVRPAGWRPHTQNCQVYRWWRNEFSCDRKVQWQHETLFHNPLKHTWWRAVDDVKAEKQNGGDRPGGSKSGTLLNTIVTSYKMQSTRHLSCLVNLNICYQLLTICTCSIILERFQNSFETSLFLYKPIVKHSSSLVNLT